MADSDWIWLLTRTLGGLGLFLLGMIVMTDSLRQLAGDSLRHFLLRFTHTPLSGAYSGAASTAVLQSSSATIVAVVGFVGAGIIGFKEALGVIFGANLGTTVTGWLVVFFGLKFQLADAMLPFILLGALLKLFSSGRIAQAGFSIAGFGLVIQGIALMQSGMGELPSLLTTDYFPGDTFSGRLQLVLLGILVTLITQSSSAGVAATLTALFAGAISFEQAACLVIGMDIGTTVTAVLATIGGSIEARRTGLSHVIYNCLVGVAAFFLISPYVFFLNAISESFIIKQGEIALVLFHTTFNFLGLLVILPFTSRFAVLVERFVKNGRAPSDFRLDESLLGDSDIALTALSRKVASMHITQLGGFRDLLDQNDEYSVNKFTTLDEQIKQSRSYVGHMHITQERFSEHTRLVAMIHILDHMHRLNDRCLEHGSAVAYLGAQASQASLNEIRSGLDTLLVNLKQGQWATAASFAAIFVEKLQYDLTSLRQELVRETAEGQFSVTETSNILDSLRWLNRISHHIERIAYYMNTIMVEERE